jgi:type IV secretion system protein VirB1
MDFLALAQNCAPTVHPHTLAAIVKTESGFKPLAIGVNKGGAQLTRQPESKAEAVTAAKALIERGLNIDMGLGQINSENLPRLGYTVEDVFDACKNLSAAALILKDNFARASAREGNEQEALKKALSAYNTGDFARGVRNGYVHKVTSNGVKLAQGYSVPAIKLDPQDVAPSPPAPGGQVGRQPAPTAPSGSVAVPRPVPKTAAPITTDPSMVFGNPPKGQDDEAEQAMVF